MKNKLTPEDKKYIKTKTEEITKAKAELLSIIEVLENYDGDDRLLAESRMKDLRDVIRVGEKQLREYEIDGEINSINTIKQIQSESEIIVDLIKRHHIGYLCEDNKYVYCMQMASDNSGGVINPQFAMVDTSKIIPVLNKMSGKILKIDAHSVRDLFQQTGNDYYRVTGSFNSEKWDNNKVYNKMQIMRQYWVQPIDEPHHPYFDMLLHTVCGGKQENIDYLKTWIAYKWLYPERSANIPNLDLGGYPGGNGKGRFIELLKTIFTHGCVIPAAKKELLDGFNASWETAVILYYDEPTANELPESKLKNATGSEEQRIEKKGIDAYTADRNYNFVFTSNNAKGVVVLAGSGSSAEDRRWSIFNTGLVMIDEFMNMGCTDEEAKVETNNLSTTIKMRAEAGKFLNTCLTTTPARTLHVLPPLHGEDYHARIETQKDRWQLIFDAILPGFKHCGVMTLELLTNFVHEGGDMHKATPKTIKDNFGRYLQQKKLNFEYVKNTSIKLTYEGRVHVDTQIAYWRLDTSQTNFQLDYSQFCRVVPEKNCNIQKNEFTIKIQ